MLHGVKVNTCQMNEKIEVVSRKIEAIKRNGNFRAEKYSVSDKKVEWR